MFGAAAASCLLAATLAILSVLVAPERMKSQRFGDYAPQVENLKAGGGIC